MSAVYRPTLEVVLTPGSGRIGRRYRMIDLRKGSTGIADAAEVFSDIDPTPPPTFVLNGIRRDLPAIVADLNIEPLERLGAYNDGNQRRIGAVLTRTVLTGLDLDRLDPGEIRIRVARGAEADDAALADALDVAPWTLMTEPDGLPDGQGIFLCESDRRGGGPIAVTSGGDRAPVDVEIPTRIRVRLFIPAGAVGQAEADAHYAACVRELQASGPRGFGPDAVTFERAQSFAQFIGQGADETPTILYLVTHAGMAEGDLFLVEQPDADMALAELGRALVRWDRQAALVVILACRSAADATLGVGAFFARRFPAVLASRAQLSFAVARSFGPAFLGLVARERYTPAQALAEVLGTRLPQDGAVAASWAALSLHLNYRSWRSIGSAGVGRLDPLWRRDLPLLLDRAAAQTQARAIGAQGIDWAERNRGLRVQVAACRGGPRSGLEEYLLRLRIELAESRIRLAVYDTVLDWNARTMPGATDDDDGHLRDHLCESLSSAIDGLRPLSGPRRAPSPASRGAGPDALAAMMAKAMTRAEGAVACFLIRHTRLRAVEGPVSVDQLMRTYLGVWKDVADLMAETRGRAIVVLAVPAEHPAADAPPPALAWDGMPLTFEPLTMIEAADVDEHLKKFRPIYNVSDGRARTLAARGEFLDVVQRLRDELFR